MEREQRDALDTERFFFNCDTVSLALLYDLAKSVSQLSDRVAELTDRTCRQPTASAADTLRDMACLLKNLLENMEGKLVLIERTPNGAGLVCCPRDMDLAVRELYFKNRFRTVLTSATLTNSAKGELQERYSYFLRSTGFPLDSVVLAEPIPSPFPYEEHAMLYYCNDLPHPTREREAFIQKGARRLADILNISHGKALVLFTSRADMEDVYALLREMELPFQILMQEDGPSQGNVRKAFQTDTDSVLLATGTYWEGISIGGRSLSNLVIFRLPFPVPDPVIDAKMYGLRDPLIEVLVPEMVIKLKQGIGRLIRSFTDTGIVSILDPRLRDAPPSRYRDTVWAALPIQNRTNSLRVLRGFYKTVQNLNQ